MRALPLTAIVTALAIAGVLAQTPQTPQPTFQAGAHTVRVYATVRDKSGAFALDLTKDDFEIRDNGKPQTVTLFTREAQPLTIVVLIDGSTSMLPVYNAVLDGVNQFVIRLMPGDQARIGSFADLVRLSPRFTPDRDELLRYLQDQFNLRMGNQTRLWDAVADSLDALGDHAGRRVVVVFSDGYDTASSTSASGDESLAERKDAMVYSIAMWSTDRQVPVPPNRRIESLAEDTGGGFYELRDTDAMSSIFTQIAEELHNQYVLGFTPAVLDGKTHHLEVKTKRPDTLVRARKTYLADANSIGG